MNFESLIESLMCQLNVNNLSERHFLDDPKYLPCCHRTACNKCIKSLLCSHKSASVDFKLVCPLCHISSKITLVDEECLLDSDNLAKIELEKNMIEINHYLVKKLETNIKNIEERFGSKENFLVKRKAFIENEIHTQVLLLKAHLDSLENEMKLSLENSTNNLRLNLEKFETIHRTEVNDLKSQIENLKLNSLSYLNGHLMYQKQNYNDYMKSKQNHLSSSTANQSIDQCIITLNEVSRLNNSFTELISELAFTPNIDLPTKSIIGNLKQISNSNLKDQFKNIKTQTQIVKIPSIPFSNQQMPISPRYLCIGDSNSLFFTDSQTKQLVHLKLDSGDYVRSTNLNGLFKNPDGICVNPKKGHIFVGDSELKCIFKLDFQFNLLKKFGMKDFKWPKGLFYDYESKFCENTNPDRLYVCDYSNQRVAIYNEHEQLRDFLTISITDDQVPSFNKTNIPDNTLMFSDAKILSNDEGYKFCPLNVKVNKTNIFVTDDWTGGNCIRIFDKITHRLVRNVGDLNAWNPLGLIIDDFGNIFTMARLYYETGATNLFCFTKDGELVYKTCLNTNCECITDIVVDKYTDKLNHKIICTGDKKLHMIQF